MNEQLTVSPAGERAIIFYLPPPALPDYPAKLKYLGNALATLAGVVDFVPAYRSLLVEFNPTMISAQEIINFAHTVEINSNTEMGKVIEIPVCYHPELAPDLENVAKQHQMSVEALIALHSGTEYDVYCLGFIPGFPFLGYVPEEIATARHQTPRAEVAAGSVGIAGRQTGIYPIASAGGWQIIGRTPLKLYDPTEGIFSLFAAGDKVKFIPISYQQFQQVNSIKSSLPQFYE